MNIKEFLSTLVAVMFVLAVIAHAVGATNAVAVFLVLQAICFIAVVVVDLIEDL